MCIVPSLIALSCEILNCLYSQTKEGLFKEIRLYRELKSLTFLMDVYGCFINLSNGYVVC